DAGPIPTSLGSGCSPWKQPGIGRADPDEETIGGRAVCGRTARTIRRAGGATPIRVGRRHSAAGAHNALRLRQPWNGTRVTTWLARCTTWCAACGGYLLFAGQVRNWHELVTAVALATGAVVWSASIRRVGQVRFTL